MTELEFKKIFDKYNKGLIYNAKMLVGDLYAEDIVADCFVKLWELRDEVKNKEGIASFLYTSVKRRCIDFFRSNKRILHNERGHVAENKYIYNLSNNLPPDIKRHLCDTGTSDEYADCLIIKSELINLICAELNKLTEKQKEIFIFVYMYDLGAAEIAGLKQVSVNTIRLQRRRLIKKFNIFSDILFKKKHWHIINGHWYLKDKYKKNADSLSF